MFKLWFKDVKTRKRFTVIVKDDNEALYLIDSYDRIGVMLIDIIEIKSN